MLFEDCDESVSYDLSVVVKHTFKSKSYWLPDVGETVLCMFLPNGEETGFILGSVYSEKDKPVPEISDENKDRDGIWFEDGSLIKYESDTNTLVLDIKGEINIKATGNVNIHGKKLNFIEG